MSSVTYTAKRRIISGHTIDTEYDIDFDSTLLDQQMRLVGSQSVSLSGTTEGINNRVSDIWTVRTEIFADASLDSWKEFLASVAAAETFTFDAYGTSGSPDNAQSVILEGQPSITRMDKAMKYQITFTVRVL